MACSCTALLYLLELILLVGTFLPHRLKSHSLHLLNLERHGGLEIRHLTSIPRVSSLRYAIFDVDFFCVTFYPLTLNKCKDYVNVRHAKLIVIQSLH
jgi:hypothetical protein